MRSQPVEATRSDVDDAQAVVVQDGVGAELKHGVMTLVLSKVGEGKPRNVAVSRRAARRNIVGLLRNCRVGIECCSQPML